MEERDKISDNYRKQVDKLLDDQSDLNLFTPLNQEEADETWEEISVELDIGEVWNDISSDLDIVMPVDSGSGLIVRSIAIVLIILTGMIPVKKILLDSGTSQQDILTETKHNEQSAEQIINNIPEDSDIGEQTKEYISPEIKKSVNADEEGKIPATVESNRSGLIRETPISISNEVIVQVLHASMTADSSLVISPDKIPIEKSGVSLAIIPVDLKKIKLFSGTDSDSLKHNDNPSTGKTLLPLIDRSKFSGGMITSFKNTWLLNYETLSGFKPETYNSTEIVFFPDVGLSLNYSLNKTWLLQVDGFLSSNTGQKYFDYINGHYSRKKITLNYSTIDFSIKYKFINSSNLQQRFSINVLAGGYISVLHYAYQKINTDLKSIGSQYRKFDFGVRLGGEFELQIFNQLSIAPGLFLSLGIPNIYKGYFGRTQNGNAVFNLTFYLH